MVTKNFEQLKFLITKDEKKDNCTLYIKSNDKDISNFHLTRTELKKLMLTIDRALNLW